MDTACSSMPTQIPDASLQRVKAVLDELFQDQRDENTAFFNDIDRFCQLHVPTWEEHKAIIALYKKQYTEAISTHSNARSFFYEMVDRYMKTIEEWQRFKDLETSINHFITKLNRTAKERLIHASIMDKESCSILSSLTTSHNRFSAECAFMTTECASVVLQMQQRAARFRSHTTRVCQTLNALPRFIDEIHSEIESTGHTVGKMVALQIFSFKELFTNIAAIFDIDIAFNPNNILIFKVVERIIDSMIAFFSKNPAVAPAPPMQDDAEMLSSLPVKAQAVQDDEPTQPNSSLDAHLCVVCLDAPPSVLLLPCRHMRLCPGCVKKLNPNNYRCPDCRAEITSTIQAFI